MNHSLAAVASRIQERNNTLCTELANLDVLRSQLTKAESDLVVNTTVSTTARVQFLSTVQDRHSVELELLRTTVEEGTRVKNEIDTLRTEIQQYQESAQNLENKFAQDYLPMYSKHSVSTALYLMECEHTLASAQTKRKQREERLCTLRTKTNQQRCMVEEMREERTRISRGFAELDRREEEDDDETMALGMQIKDLLTKKASVRKELNTMREVQQSALSNREKWQRRTADGTLDY